MFLARFPWRRSPLTLDSLDARLRSVEAVVGLRDVSHEGPVHIAQPVEAALRDLAKSGGFVFPEGD